MTAEPFDVVVIGSGAAGGTAAYALTKAGARVCVVEAGRHYDPVAETPMFNTNRQAPLAGTGTPDKPFGFYDATVDGGWQVPGEPYSSTPGTDFRWWRSRMLGGRTNHWGRISLRFAEHDFKGRSWDGHGVDWPFGYAEIAPWYDLAERFIGVTGATDGLDDQPDSPDGVLMPCPPPRAHERLIMAAGRKLGRPVVANRLAILTKPINGRSACIYATPCGRGCSIAANFQSTTVMLRPAMATGKLTVLTNAFASEIDLDREGKAKGVHYVDRQTGEHRYVAGRQVVLAASALESARLLMNSKSPRFPNGIGADSGVLGRYIMDTTGSSVHGQLPILEDLPPHNEDGLSSAHVYVPWWGLKDAKAGRLKFAKGYHLEIWGGRGEPGDGISGGVEAFAPSAWGKRLKREARRYYGTFVGLSQRGEALPYASNYCEIDPERRDRYGVPTLRFTYRWSDQELEQTRHAQGAMREFIEAAGGKVLSRPSDDPAKVIAKPGQIIHEVGGTRAGTSAKDSVVDPYGKVWGVPNLWVMDGGVFPSNAHKNPTLTIIAFAWRASDALMRSA